MQQSSEGFCCVGGSKDFCNEPSLGFSVTVSATDLQMFLSFSEVNMWNKTVLSREADSPPLLSTRVAEDTTTCFPKLGTLFKPQVLGGYPDEILQGFDTGAFSGTGIPVVAGFVLKQPRPDGEVLGKELPGTEWAEGF